MGVLSFAEHTPTLLCFAIKSTIVSHVDSFKTKLSSKNNVNPLSSETVNRTSYPCFSLLKVPPMESLCAPNYILHKAFSITPMPLTNDLGL